MKTFHRILIFFCALHRLVGSAAAPATLPASLPGSTALYLDLVCAPFSLDFPVGMSNCGSDGVSLTTTERTFVILDGMSQEAVFYEDIPFKEVVPVRVVPP